MNRKQSILSAILATAALVAAFSLTGAAVANAAPPGGGAASPSTDSCWIDSNTQQSLCVPAGADLLAAVQQQDGVTISVPAGAVIGGKTVTAGRAAASQLVPAGAQSSIAVSALYDDVNYGGGSIVMTGSSCNSGIPNLGDYGWNDRASSFKSYNGCWTALWQNINYGGSHIGYAPSAPSFGSFNDQASSWHTE
jgi:hypothetical protein